MTIKKKKEKEDQKIKLIKTLNITVSAASLQVHKMLKQFLHRLLSHKAYYLNAKGSSGNKRHQKGKQKNKTKRDSNSYQRF